MNRDYTGIFYPNLQPVLFMILYIMIFMMGFIVGYNYYLFTAGATP